MRDSRFRIFKYVPFRAFAISWLFWSFTVHAQAPAAETAARTFVTHLESVSPAEIYEEELGPTFKDAVKKAAFISNMGILKIQTGGASLARQTLGGQAFSQTPTGQTGEFYYVRFKTRFPTGMVFQDVYLEKVAASWKVSGYWMFPAPAN